MKSTLKISDRTGALLFAIASVFVASIICGGDGLGADGGYHGGGTMGGMSAGAFTLVSPPDDAPKDPGHTLLTVTPTLTWTQSPGATGYIVQISKTIDFSSPVISVSVSPTITSYTLTTEQALQSGIHYYWRVTAYIIFTQQISASNAPFTFTPQ
jgi:hypothetical protein